MRGSYRLTMNRSTEKYQNWSKFDNELDYDARKLPSPDARACLKRGFRPRDPPLWDRRPPEFSTCLPARACPARSRPRFTNWRWRTNATRAGGCASHRSEVSVLGLWQQHGSPAPVVGVSVSVPTSGVGHHRIASGGCPGLIHLDILDHADGVGLPRRC